MNQTSDPLSELQAIAREYHHNPNQQALLEPVKEPVLLLRAKYASYEVVTEILAAHGVNVPLSVLRKFCRRHYDEMLKVRHGLQKETPTGTSNI